MKFLLYLAKSNLFILSTLQGDGIFYFKFMNEDSEIQKTSPSPLGGHSQISNKCLSLRLRVSLSYHSSSLEVKNTLDSEKSHGLLCAVSSGFFLGVVISLWTSEGTGVVDSLLKGKVLKNGLLLWKVALLGRSRRPESSDEVSFCRCLTLIFKMSGIKTI